MKRTTIILTALTIIGATILSGCSSNSSTAEKPNNAQSISESENLVISLSEVSENASFYPVEIDGIEMEVIAVKDSSGNVRTAFNTCQVCYGSGNGYYKQSGNTLVCQNCGNQFTMEQVEIESGGCNPWPIFDENKEVTDDAINISYDFLKQSEQIFANWRKSF